MELSANIETLFHEVGDDLCERMRAAAQAGFRHVEMWMTQGRDVAALSDTAQELGLTFTSMVAGPRFNLQDAQCHEEFWATLRNCLADARALECRNVVVTTGVGVPYRCRGDQLASVACALAGATAMAEEADVTLLLENVNTRVDHPGSLTDRVEDNAWIVREVGSDRVALLLDFYHAIVMGEDPHALIDSLAGMIGYAQLAEVPGRGEPTGVVDWPAILKHLADVGYDAPLGLELSPTQATVPALEYICGVARRI